MVPADHRERKHWGDSHVDLQEQRNNVFLWAETLQEFGRVGRFCGAAEIIEAVRQMVSLSAVILWLERRAHELWASVPQKYWETSAGHYIRSESVRLLNILSVLQNHVYLTDISASVSYFFLRVQTSSPFVPLMFICIKSRKWDPIPAGHMWLSYLYVLWWVCPVILPLLPLYTLTTSLSLSFVSLCVSGLSGNL